VVFHLHVHVLPRHNGVALLPPASRKEYGKVLEENAARLIAALKKQPSFRDGALAPDLRCAIAHRGISRFRVRCFRIAPE